MENHLKTLLLSRTSLAASFRIFGVLASFTGILLGGIYTKIIFRYLTLFYDQLFTVFGLNSVLQHIQTHTSTLVTMRSLPTMATYGIAYTACGFLFLHFAFKSPQKSRLAASFYLFIFLTCILLIVLGTLFPKLDITYKLSRRLIELIISPFPIIFLSAVFYAFFPSQEYKKQTLHR